MALALVTRIYENSGFGPHSVGNDDSLALLCELSVDLDFDGDDREIGQSYSFVTANISRVMVQHVVSSDSLEFFKELSGDHIVIQVGV